MRTGLPSASASPRPRSATSTSTSASCGSAKGRLFTFLAIDRVSKFVHVTFFDANTKLNGAAFLREVVQAFPYAIHTVLTDNGMAFADLPEYRDGPTARWMGHIFDRVCREHGIEHRLTKPYHPWTNGQAERMNRTVKEATVKAFHYPDLDALRAHVLAFVTAYNARRQRVLDGRTPDQVVAERLKARRKLANPKPHGRAGPADIAAARSIAEAAKDVSPPDS